MCLADRPQNNDTFVIILMEYDWSAMRRIEKIWWVAYMRTSLACVGAEWALSFLTWRSMPKREIIINLKTAAVDFSDNIGSLNLIFHINIAKVK